MPHYNEATQNKTRVKESIMTEGEGGGGGGEETHVQLRAPDLFQISKWCHLYQLCISCAYK